jgi:hypothetical protein
MIIPTAMYPVKEHLMNLKTSADVNQYGPLFVIHVTVANQPTIMGPVFEPFTLIALGTKAHAYAKTLRRIKRKCLKFNRRMDGYLFNGVRGRNQ